MIFKKFSITKRIAKHGNQSIIVIPKIIEQSLKPGTIVSLEISVIDNLELENDE
ncbi:MAG: hypothetical protein WCK29_03645 [archaeon]